MALLSCVSLGELVVGILLESLGVIGVFGLPIAAMIMMVVVASRNP